MEDLQTLWHKAQRQEDAHTLPDQQIDKMIRQKSRGIFDKFTRTVLGELLFNVLFTLGTACYVMMSELKQFPLIMGVMFLMLAGYQSWQFAFYRRLRRHATDHDIHGYLQSSLRLLKQFVFHYKIVYGIVTPISIMLGFWLGMRASQADVELPLAELPENPWMASVVVAGTLAIVLLCIHLNLKYLYQKKIDRMQQLVNDLERP